MLFLTTIQSLYFQCTRFALDKKLRKKWIVAIKRKNFSVHLTDHDYQICPNANRQFLKANTIPSVFSHFQLIIRLIKNQEKCPSLLESMTLFAAGILTIYNYVKYICSKIKNCTFS